MCYHTEGNSFTGTVPKEIGDLANLKTLNAGSNNLEGVQRTGSVQILDLVNNTEWEIKAEFSGAFSFAQLGATVALSDDGKRVAIGAPSEGSDKTGYIVSA